MDKKLEEAIVKKFNEAAYNTRLTMIEEDFGPKMPWGVKAYFTQILINQDDEIVDFIIWENDFDHDFIKGHKGHCTYDDQRRIEFFVDRHLSERSELDSMEIYKQEMESWL